MKLRKELKDNLRHMYDRGRGTSKHVDKKRNSGKPRQDKIYSRGTQKTYAQQVDRFTSWCYDRNIRDLGTARDAVPDYLQELIDSGRSANTIHTAAFALAKAFDCHAANFGVELPLRHRADYTRSRGDAVRDRSFAAAKNQDLIKFCEASGLRRRELEHLRSRDVYRDRSGNLMVHVDRGKGGKSRDVRVYADRETRAMIWERARSRSDNELMWQVRSHMDVHHYRAIYAARVYRAHARPIDQIPRRDRYYCRGEKRGTVYDRRALLAASRELGHNRADVIAQSYLYTL